jgi:hypothetical protein
LRLSLLSVHGSSPEPENRSHFPSCGALIQGFRRQVRLGELLEVQLGTEKCQFRVVWIGNAASRRGGEIGLESIAVETGLWNLNLWQCSQFAAHG